MSNTQMIIKKRLIVPLIILALIAPSTSFAWWDSSWSNKFAITSTQSLVDITTSSMTLLIDLSNAPAGFWSAVQADGDDIRITSSTEDGTLNYELVGFSVASTTGELYINTGTDGISSTTAKTFYVYYGNAGASTGEDPNAAWADHYAFVGHFNATSTDSATVSYRPTVILSGVSISGDGGSGGVNSVMGGYAQNTAANGYGCYNSAPTSTSNSSFSFSMWTYAAAPAAGAWWSIGTDKGTVNGGHTIGEGTTNLSSAGSDIFFLQGGIAWIDSTADNSNNVWQHLFHSRDGVTDTFYQNGTLFYNADKAGTLDDTIMSILNRSASTDDCLGDFTQYGWNANEARIDEVRVSTAKLPNGFVVTEYNNMHATSTFWAFGAQESAPPVEAVAAPSMQVIWWE